MCLVIIIIKQVRRQAFEFNPLEHPWVFRKHKPASIRLHFHRKRVQLRKTTLANFRKNTQRLQNTSRTQNEDYSCHQKYLWVFYLRQCSGWDWSSETRRTRRACPFGRYIFVEKNLRKILRNPLFSYKIWEPKWIRLLKRTATFKMSLSKTSL